MALTTSFRETVGKRVITDPAFRRELLCHAVELMLAGDLPTGKAVLRDYIDATVGFIPLAEALGLSPKSIQRTVGPSGNPRADTLFRVIAYCRRREGMRLEVRDAA